MKLKHISFMRLESRFKNGLPKLADMLRYDTAFQSQQDPHYVAFPVFITKDGNLGGQITHGRWHSFGVYVKYIPKESEADSLSIHSIHKDQWITYRHPRTENGPCDYGKLVPVTLEEYICAKSTESLAIIKEQA